MKRCVDTFRIASSEKGDKKTTSKETEMLVMFIYIIIPQLLEILRTLLQHLHIVQKIKINVTISRDSTCLLRTSIDYLPHAPPLLINYPDVQTIQTSWANLVHRTWRPPLSRVSPCAVSTMLNLHKLNAFHGTGGFLKQKNCRSKPFPVHITQAAIAFK